MPQHGSRPATGAPGANRVHARSATRHPGHGQHPDGAAAQPAQGLALPAPGLPPALRASIESLSGLDMGDVRVHHDSPRPAALNARAYTLGHEIHVAPGQQQHLAHEAWHVVQQKQGRVAAQVQRKSTPMNDDPALEREADTMGARAARLAETLGPASLPAPGQRAPGRLQRSAVPTAVQRAIGLEIEVPIPVDDLTPDEANQLAQEVEAAKTATNPGDMSRHKNEATRFLRKAPYGTVRDSADGFHVDVDHDDRVKTLLGPNNGWPPREPGRDSIMEIVTEPAATEAAFDTTMDKVASFVGEVNRQTGRLKHRWTNAFGNGINIGPMSYAAHGIADERRPAHNWKGSVQVNIGIDLREYASLANWYAKSSWSKASRAAPGEREAYQGKRDQVTRAVDAGRQIVDELLAEWTDAQKQWVGNLRGLRGWLTHLGLYLLGGSGGVPNSTVKNITPILLKSPQDVAIHYGMTAAEENYYLTNREFLLKRLVQAVGRNDIVLGNVLNGDVVTGKGSNTAYQEAVEEDLKGTAVAAMNSRQQNALVAYGTNLGQLSEPANRVAYAGKPIAGAQPLGSPRTGSQEVHDIPGVANDFGLTNRGGVVVEFRNLPGFHEGPSAWRKLGKDFLKQANKRNRRGGVEPR